ncbi:DsbA family protein [Cellulomonas carbonis]|uniref:DSBA oxidoreductase n=1 Tax=Cellulomonas carbonis T26 TaxID=947969 RepID=A0A0A0BMG8_9CELL|nr:thioredoxin domain-containing protein [Cellulomonas carbonis]KGM09693.1 DSBA oxidoreductase [Cellulomonas carbonis T26]GGC05278.1 hypothetical protein GCM10010972_18030 [Cellulomonas carbonis]
MSSSPRPSKADRRDEARAAALALRAQQEREARRQRTILLSLIGVGLVAVVAVVVWILGQATPTTTVDIPDADLSEVEEPLAEVTAPAGATDDGGILVGAEGVLADGEAPDDAVVVDVYADFMCPFCGLFEETNGATLDELRESGDVVVAYHPVAILDRFASGTKYSTRSSAALALVADQAPEQFVDLNTILFANQPAEGSEGLSDAEMAELAREVGVPDDVATAIEDGSYLTGDGSFVPWVQAATEQASRDLPRLATPTVLVDGQDLSEDLGVDWRIEGALAAAVEQVRG